MKSKSALRKAFLDLRSRSFSNSVQTEIQRKLVDFLLSKKYQNIGLYHPIRGEVDVFAILEALPQRSVYLPRVKGERLEFVSVGEGDELVEGAFGILEPEGPVVDPRILDLVVVPGIAFTEAGNRLGYGGGFYDRFLASLDCTCVGVCQDLFLTDYLPMQSHDQRMDFVITETDVYKTTNDVS